MKSKIQKAALCCFLIQAFRIFSWEQEYLFISNFSFVLSLSVSLPPITSTSELSAVSLPCLPAYFHAPYHDHHGDNGLTLWNYLPINMVFLVSKPGHRALHRNRTKTNMVLILFLVIYLYIWSFLNLFYFCCFELNSYYVSLDWPGTHFVD